MPEPDLLAQRREWFSAGEFRLLELLAAAPDLRLPSLLPGWSRAHLVAHLIGNADALGNLVHWARTGEPTPMYTDAAARAAQIDRDAARDDAWLLKEASASSERLGAALAAMTPADWDAPVRTAQGREVSASQIPWMRLRENTIHALDLDLGASLDWCPAPLIDALITDTAATVGAREGCPAVLLAPSDREQTWRMGPDTVPDTRPARPAAGPDAMPDAGSDTGLVAVTRPDAGPDTPPVAVTGPAVQLLTWVVGRRSDRTLPVLPRWL